MKSFIFKTVAAFSCVCNVSIVHAQSSAAFVNTASSTQSVKKIQKPTPSMGSFAQVRVVQGASPTFKRDGLPLYAKKKKKDTTVGKSGKIQVKLLKYVAGTGSAGEVIMVAPAFFANKLQKTGSAVRISDDDVEKESEVQKQKDAHFQKNEHNRFNTFFLLRTLQLIDWISLGANAVNIIWNA